MAPPPRTGGTSATGGYATTGNDAPHVVKGLFSRGRSW